jgi:rfaE bifunctional protein nucleotidyltransferase chain/domain
MNKFDAIQQKVRGLQETARQVEKWQMAGEKVVFTNGCFDILHAGHVTYLAKAADFGTKLVIGLNTDLSVKRQGKGEERPVNPEQARALVLASLSFVDGVVLFEDDTPQKIIQLLQPDVLVKGADYDPEETDPSKKNYIVGREEVLLHGGIVKTVNLVDGFSTTNIIRKLRS